MPEHVPAVSPVRRAGRWLATAGAVCAGAALVAVAGLPVGHRVQRRVGWAVHIVSRWVLRALGIRRSVEGVIRSGPSLVVGNHVSFLDILVLASLSPMRMVAKSDVAGWPLIGAIATGSGTVFLRRSALRELPATVEEMTAALRGGARVQVFPEGTTRCGGALDPFRRAAFQAAIDAAVVVTPVALRYVGADGAPTSAVAFLGEETLWDCLRRVIGTAGLRAQARVLPAIPGIAGTGRAHQDRRILAGQAERAIARALDSQVVGRTGGAVVPARAGTSDPVPVTATDSAAMTPGRAAARGRTHPPVAA